MRQLYCEDNMYYTYIIKCGNDNLYTGITTDVERRFSEHKYKSKLSAKYTRANPAVEVKAVWSSKSRALASRLEYFIKTLSRKNKLELIMNPQFLKEKYSDVVCVDEYNFEFEIISNINEKNTP